MRGDHTARPAANELELSLFGRGVGECIVVHLGSDEWMVVDSCLNARQEQAIALDYLSKLGVDISAQLKLIVITHWHDDHIRGAAQLLACATSAKFACSAAMNCDEFLQLVSASKYVKTVDHTSGITEFGNILDILDSRCGANRRAGPDHWACDGMRLYSGSLCNIVARSPSAQTFTDAAHVFAQLLPKKFQPIRRFHADAGPNERSVVLLVEGQVSALLGADLEVGSDDRRGWRAVVEGANTYGTRAHAYKVAHHGSSNADFEGIWDALLVQAPMAVVTPYARGSRPLPAPEDIERMKLRAEKVYCTVWPATVSPPKRNKTVDRTMNEIVLSRRALQRVPGHIRIRTAMNGSGSASIELFDGATSL